MDKIRNLTFKEYMRSTFPIEELKEVGFFKKSDTSYKRMAKRICKFFGYKDIHEYEESWKKLNSQKDLPVKADINTFSEN